MKNVIVAAPVKDNAALNVVMGVNDRPYDPKRHRLHTAVSCATNCPAPVVKVAHEAIGVSRSDHDHPRSDEHECRGRRAHKDLRRARSANAVASAHDGRQMSAMAVAIPLPPHY